MRANTLRSCLLPLVFGMLAACGGGSGDGGQAATGTVAVVFTDGPTDRFERIIFRISRITLIGPGGQVALYDGAPIEFDVLEMSHWADLGFTTEVLAGPYNKIRLEIEEIRMIDLGELPNDSSDDDVVVLDKLPANGHVDLNPQGPFEITAGTTTVIKLDIDAERAFQVVSIGDGNNTTEEYRFRPVVFVEIYERENINIPDRLVRVFGTVQNGSQVSGPEEQSFRLCALEFPSQTNSVNASNPDACVHVHAGGASIFGDMGTGAEFAAVTDGSELTAVGFLVGTNDTDAALGLNAVVVEIGVRKPPASSGWSTLDGLVSEAPVSCDSNECFEFSADGGTETFTVALQPTTRVFRADGAELDRNAVIVDAVGSIDGYESATPDGNPATEEVGAALVVLAGRVQSDVVAGHLDAVRDADGYYVLDVTEIGGGVQPKRICVDLDTVIAQVLVVGDALAMRDLIDPTILDPADGYAIEAYGDSESEGRDCDFAATQVIVSSAN